MKVTDAPPTQSGDAIAVDVGGTKLAVALVRDGAVIDYDEIQTPNDVVQTLIPALSRLVRKWQTTGTPIGVATTGVVVNGKVSALNPNVLPFPLGFPIHELISRHISPRVIVVNDGQAAAWGEARFGSGRNVDTFAYITVSTGIGGGVVVSNRLIQGATGLAGHFGHMTTRLGGPVCGCGKRACVEAIASGRAIAAAANAAAGQVVEVRDVFEQDAPPELAKIATRAAKAVADLCANLKAALDVSVIAVGGSIGLNEHFRYLLSQQLDILPNAFKVTCVKPGLEKHAGLIGAADLALADR